MLLQLICAVVGKNGITTVEIDDRVTVGMLAKRIAKDLKYTGVSSDLKMYLTKGSTTEGGERTDEWLTTRDPDYGLLSRGDEHTKAAYLESEKLLDHSWLLQRYFDNKTPRDKVIHILVKFPHEVINIPGEQTSLLNNIAVAQPKITKSCSLKYLFWTAVFLAPVLLMLHVAVIADARIFTFEGKKLEQIRDLCACAVALVFGLGGLLYCDDARNSANE